MKKATYWGYMFEAGVDTSLTSPDINSSKLSHISGYAPFRFGWGRICCALSGFIQATYVTLILTGYKFHLIYCTVHEL
jgi:hypothetical protein